MIHCAHAIVSISVYVAQLKCKLKVTSHFCHELHVQNMYFQIFPYSLMNPPIPPYTWCYGIIKYNYGEETECGFICTIQEIP